jgi:hypothetical protein
MSATLQANRKRAEPGNLAAADSWIEMRAARRRAAARTWRGCR